MSVIIKGETYYRTREACRVVGIQRSTLLRWFKSGIIRMENVRRTALELQ